MIKEECGSEVLPRVLSSDVRGSWRVRKAGPGILHRLMIIVTGPGNFPEKSGPVKKILKVLWAGKPLTVFHSKKFTEIFLKQNKI